MHTDRQQVVGCGMNRSVGDYIRQVGAVIRDIRDSRRKALERRWEEEFIQHNRTIWRDYGTASGQGEILIEQFTMPTSVVAHSYFANVLSRKFGAKIRAYRPKRVNSSKSKSDKALRLQQIYGSFNAKGLAIQLTAAQHQASKALLTKILGQLKTKRDVEGLRVDGVLIGDLVYDSHLMNHCVPTVDLQDERFRMSLQEALDYFVFWRDYLDSHDVRAVIISHCVYYEFATVLRLALARGIPGYQVNATHVYRLSEEDLWAYTEFRYYPEEFRRLLPEEKRRALEIAKQRIDKRLNGEIGVDMRYSRKSAYARTGRKRILPESPRPKILIATHCFFDSPHGYGIGLFPDFYEWLDFLGKISEKTDYDWYIKTHPDYLPGTMEIVKGFVEKYPKWTLLPAHASHLQLIEDGLDAALSVYGTIGVEYAALGRTVINASPCTPSIAYGFNINPRTMEEYEDILTHLPGSDHKINIQEVYEYYYLRFVDHVDDWLYSDYDGFLNEVGGYWGQTNAVSYSKFLGRFTKHSHTAILRSLENFVDSGDFNLRRRHCSRSIGLI